MTIKMSEHPSKLGQAASAGSSRTVSKPRGLQARFSAKRAGLFMAAVATAMPIPEVISAALLPGVNLMARAEAAQLNLAPIQPRPGVGVQSLFTVYLAQDNPNPRPIVNTPVQIWLSGPYGFNAPVCTARTDRQGKVSCLGTIPIQWKGIVPWVNLNAASTAAAVATSWRILKR